MQSDSANIVKRLSEALDTPSNTKGLWHDRRDVNRWWMFWAVILIGVTSLLLSVLSIISQLLKLFTTSQKRLEVLGAQVPNLPSVDIEDSVPGREKTWSTSKIVAFCLSLFIFVAGVAVIVVHQCIERKIWTFRLKKLTDGSFRVNWQCHCGKNLQDNVWELEPGAALALSISLSVEKPVREPRLALTSELDTESQKSAVTRSGLASLFAWISTAKAETPNQQTRIINSKTEGCASSEPLYLLLCIQKSDGSIQLAQEEVTDITADRALFQLLRHRYNTTRGKWLPFFSLRSLHSINFVQFELWSSGEVDLMQYLDERMLPPPNHKDYSYRSTGVLPPVAPGRLMHLWTTPNHADGNGPTCLSRFPKKKRERLYVDASGHPAQGWGIHLAEGWNLRLLTVLAILLFLGGSLAFGITFAVLHHDIQSAFAVASYAIACPALLVGACSFCSRKLDRGGSEK